MVLPSGFPEPANIGVIEVKQYPQYRAVTYTHAGDLRQATGIAFNPLFQHISNNQIAMTTPVEARYTANSEQIDAIPVAEVSFLYPAPNIAPSSVNPAVEVTDTSPMTVVSIGVRGAYSWESYENNLSQLKDWLQQHPEYEIAGPPRRFFYNSPMTPESTKISEVQIPIERSNK
ncbi:MULTISPECIES: heme-binding protein [unclassified Microcoleus]|uniref:heme-binding protein n=1 Tax=unclassified Microcoleus TaxID=2642155 RepID=UPI001DA516BC|nr:MULTISPECIES: heme-binding protein [unclassified Microcoleus]MCC3595345.1 heme-binding protein [Microcoleus sp. PH2017_26_ELK_O_A]MCC3620398.1 heme-binding protein [Microcoleus sp. PH2017_36_ELK_O_B]